MGNPHPQLPVSPASISRESLCKLVWRSKPHDIVDFFKDDGSKLAARKGRTYHKNVPNGANVCLLVALSTDLLCKLGFALQAC